MTLLWYRDLAVATAQAIGWSRSAAAHALALSLAVLQRWTSPSSDAMLMFLAVVVIAAATAFVVDDDAATTLSHSLTSQRERLLLRVGLGLAAGTAAFTVVVATARAANGSLPGGTWALLWISLTGLAMAIASVANRVRPDASASLMGAGVLLVGAVIVSALPAMTLSADLARLPTWDEPAERTVWTVAASLAALWWASRDPASRGRAPRKHDESADKWTPAGKTGGRT